MEIINLFIIGALYGFTTCSLTCLPYLGPYMMGVGGGFKDGMNASLFFIAGKIITYSALSGTAAWLGMELIKGDEDFLKYIISIPLIFIGLMLLFKKDKSSGCSNKPFASIFHKTANKKTHLFIMGVLTSIIPCVPLSALLLLAIKSGSIFNGALYGLVYGSGLIVSPIVIAGGFFGFISERIKIEMPDMAKIMRTVSAVAIIFAGITATGFLSL